MSNLFTQPILTFLNNGLPLNNGLVFFYNSGTTTKATVYQDNSGTVAPNPVTLNSNGNPVNGSTVIPIYFPHGQAIKISVYAAGAGDPPTGSALMTIDPSIGESDIDIGNYLTATSSTTLTVTSGKTLAIAGTLDVSSGGLKLAVIKDSNGNTILTFAAASNAVNGITITDAATGNDPSIAASGSDTNISLDIKGKGTGAIKLGQTTATGIQLVADQPIQDSSGNNYLSFTKTATAVNAVTLSNNSTGNSPTIGGTGTDSTVGLNITNKNGGPTALTNNALNFAAPVTIASAATVNIGAAASNNITISGTTTITAFDTVSAGVMRFVTFSGTLTLTYNATSLLLPGAANITTAAGDTAIFESLGSGNWKCLQYTVASSPPGGTTADCLNNMQVFTSSGTYTKTAGTNSLLIICMGGGGGSGGGGNPGTNGGSGGTTSFGTLCVATGGSGGTGGTASANGVGGAGGTISGGTGTLKLPGSQGGSNASVTTANTAFGAVGLFGMGGATQALITTAGVAGGTNTGAGAAAGTANGTDGGGGGGGSGAMSWTFTTTTTTQTVTIGAGGSAGTGSVGAGALGGSGICIVLEFK